MPPEASRPYGALDLINNIVLAAADGNPEFPIFTEERGWGEEIMALKRERMMKICRLI